MRSLTQISVWIKFHKKYLMISCIVLFGVLLLFRSMVFAEPDANGLLNVALGYLDDLADNSKYSEISDMLAISISDDESYICGRRMDGIGNIVTTVNNLAQSYAVAIIVITFLVGYFNMQISQQEITIEILFKKFLMLIAMIWLTTEAMNISLVLCTIGDEFAGKISASSAANYDIAPLKAEMIAACEAEHDFGPMIPNWLAKGLSYVNNSFITPISFILSLFIPWVVQKVCWLIVQVTCFSRAIEVIVLSSMSPFACCMAHEGQTNLGHGTATRLFKNIGAVALQGAIIIVIMKVSAGLTVGTFDSLLDGGFTAKELGNAAWTSCVASVASAGLCMRSLSIGQKIMGLQ